MATHSPNARAEALIEALPFIQKFRGALFVIKYGGSAMEDEHVVERFLRDVVFLEAVGINPVLIHGGGKAITQKMREAGLKPRFVNGLRVTDEQSIRIVEDVLDQDINPSIVALLKGYGGKAVGIHGKNVLVGKKLPPQTEGKSSAVDLGFVGEVVEVNAALKDKPEAVNKDPHGSWMVVIKLSNTSEAGALLDAAQYQDLIK